jgi:hypothetical protein
MSYSIIECGLIKKDLNEFDMQLISSIGLPKGGTNVDRIIINNTPYGGGGGTPDNNVLELGPTEYIAVIEFRSDGDLVDYLKITTNQKRSIHVGEAGNHSTYNGKLIAISGKTGIYVDYLRFLIEDQV